jgi:molybdopterin-containing oxidoreductase family membrane subunit
MSAITPATPIAAPRRALPSVRRDALWFWSLAGAAGVVLLVALGAAHYMETAGHIVTGMDNAVVWGLPHVFAIFLIVAASGVLNVASIGTVFGQPVYKARAPLAGLLSLAMLAGGLMVLVLDLGRPERLIVAATHYNFRSIFAWNVILYSGLFAVVLLYLWTMMEKRMNRFAKPAGVLTFVWRIVLTTGTGSIFGFLVARQAYATAVLAPLFIVLSFTWGLAVFLIVQAALNVWNAIDLQPVVLRRTRRLLAIFVASSLYLTAVHHATNLYFARQWAVERFLLADFSTAGGVYPLMFWVGYVLLGSAVPMLLLWRRADDAPDAPAGLRAVLAASLLVTAGGFALLYAFIIGGQAFPLEIFPGYAASSSFGDGQVASYVPSIWELTLGIGGLAAAFLITIVGVRLFDFVPHDDPRALSDPAKAK